jgi:hypothetical protein
LRQPCRGARYGKRLPTFVHKCEVVHTRPDCSAATTNVDAIVVEVPGGELGSS